MGILAALSNIQVTNSVKAGGAAGTLIYIAGSLLVASNFIIPFLGVPLTIGEVGALATIGGPLVTAIVPDSVKQHINALAAKSVEVLSQMPKVSYAETDFPNAPPQITTTNNIAAAQAIAVIQSHVDDFPKEVKS